MPCTLFDWLTYINALHSKRIDLGLDRVTIVAKRLAVCEFPASTVITIGGTNGKGSTGAILQQTYLHAGYKVGSYTSPHLMCFNERVLLNGEMVSDEQLTNAFAMVEAARGDIALSFFEFTTLAALYIFKKAELDILLLEIGLGGRLDAVNIVDNDVSIVTSIDLDHMDWLGNTKEAIAIEKAGIARANKPFVSGDPNPPDTLKETVLSIGGNLYQSGIDFFITASTDAYQWQFKNNTFEVKHNVHGLKSDNISAALMAVHILQNKLPVSKAVINQSIANTKLSGRFEIGHPYPIVMDVAHNPAASAWLGQQYQAFIQGKENKTIGLVAMLSDKAMIDTVEMLNPCVDIWYVAGLDCERGSDGQALFEFLKTNSKKKCYYFNTVTQGCDHWFNQNNPTMTDHLLVFGSFYTVAEAKRWIALRSG